MDQILVDLKCVKVYIISTTDNVSISVGGQKEPVQSPLIKNYFFGGGVNTYSFTPKHLD